MLTALTYQSLLYTPTMHSDFHLTCGRGRERETRGKKKVTSFFPHHLPLIRPSLRSGSGVASPDSARAHVDRRGDNQDDPLVSCLMIHLLLAPQRASGEIYYPPKRSRANGHWGLGAGRGIVFVRWEFTPARRTLQIAKDAPRQSEAPSFTCPG